VEGGVEAGHGRHPGKSLRDGVERREGRGLVQRRQVGELPERGLDLAIDPGGDEEAPAAVDDAMPDRLGLPQLADRRHHVAGVHPAPLQGKLALAQRGLLLVDEGELEAAGARVDDEDAHRGGGMVRAGRKQRRLDVTSTHIASG